MTELTFAQIVASTKPIDVAQLTPDLLQGKSHKQICNLELSVGLERIKVSDIFEVDGKDSECIQFSKVSSLLNNVGSNMSTGTITVKGDAGDFVGRGMRGGQILIKGNTGSWAGTQMRGGHIEIQGDAGDYAGAAPLNQAHGMRGGSLLILGNAGDRLGEKMRRGIIVVNGDIGSYLATGMLAGSILSFGKVGEFCGFAMKRGTLILAEKSELPATFNECGTYDFGFLNLFYKHVVTLNRRLKDLKSLPSVAERWVGDLACDGKGEVFFI